MGSALTQTNMETERWSLVDSGFRAMWASMFLRASVAVSRFRISGNGADSQVQSQTVILTTP